MIFKNTENIRSEFFSLFDNEFKSSAPHFSSLQCNPAENEVVQPFLNNSLYQIYTKVGAICSENSQNLLDVTSLTGFEAVYVVLEFLFVYLEITKDRTNPGALQMYGEGVMAGAAAILLVTNQQNLYNSFSICETIVRRYETDFSVVDNPTVRKFAKVYSHVYSAMKLALTTYQPAVDTIFTYM
ncbi:hypothetical protein TRFO_23083 [Tritrichomonas foetus]|uniref:Uncharacterized protein n=1 Tax=Tritrichomonas foetus TaxID=1144522 RepID=A0A1J4KGD5_9EUKA|nr:hypothetical protein TRFO_23083 [Tritrichomonas foetus]|eukprot:OHT08405.1 hypothetical protein TRFO_23083 [Tritrichomonas foetus]